MPLTPAKVEKALLQFNYFPRIAKRADEFPPCFSSEDFTSELASKLINIPIARKDGFGVISARSTRFDLAPRSLEIPHPRAYANLVRNLKSSWPEWEEVVENEVSAITVRLHEDGRIFSMEALADRSSLLSPGDRFEAHVDISNFYGSIYTHSLPWAIHGVDAAKKIRENAGEWSNQLDKRLRESRRRETTGISAGPGTSSIIGEILLTRVDTRLTAQGFNYLRFIDDYYFYAKSRETAEQFVEALRAELLNLKLSIHPGKTTIKELPVAATPQWMRRLRLMGRELSTQTRVLDLLAEAVAVANEDSENGVLRFALVQIEHALLKDNLLDSEKMVVLNRLLHLGYLRPVAVGIACRILLVFGSEKTAEFADALNLIAQAHSRTLRTDAVTWILYTLLAAQQIPSAKTLDAIVSSADCLALALLAKHEKTRGHAMQFLDNFEASEPSDYRRDEYWLLYHELSLKTTLRSNVPLNYYSELKPLRDAGVSFVSIPNNESNSDDLLSAFIANFQSYSAPNYGIFY
ncbi:RNA-directed DNA polymerase [Rathayibacter sp. VKM Ac-2929]|uniref:RNA-directed DNA polymerase n=1 Tax=Rathayibacter sp. VKM Ac-2929 TaxID=2929480 RepID=UPI001FB26C1A|nr:RNA-directed DNA polymerase [Rathayibacter sp. VKM Ac-2929]MCJ1671718.1 RNA-directed DNA polymerase [Rathayibacter sp. VKM Ac-2929]